MSARHGATQMGVKDNQQPRFRLRRVIEDHVLRPIIIYGYSNPYEMEVDVLECGHVLSASRDLYGYTYPSRRRCFECMGDRPQLGTLVVEEPRESSTGSQK